MKLLLVEDHDVTLRCLDLILSSKQYFVKTACSVEEAKAVLAVNIPLDRVVIDYYLPGEDGLALLKYMRAQAAYRDVPVVFITAAGPYRLEQIQRDSIGLGPVKIVTKPFTSTDVLIEALR